MSEVVVKQQLEQYISKIEGLQQEKTDLSEEIKDIFQDASSHGFDVKAMRAILKLKKHDKDKLAEQDAMLDLYRDALGINSLMSFLRFHRHSEENYIVIEEAIAQKKKAFFICKSQDLILQTL